MKHPLLLLAAIIVPFLASGQLRGSKDSLKYYDFCALAQYDMIGDNAAAVYFLTKAIHIDPGDYGLFLRRADAKGLLCNWQGMEDDLNMAIALDPGNMAAHILRATAHEKLKKYRDAIKDYDYLISVEPSYEGYYLGRGMNKIPLNDLEGACADFQHASKRGNYEAFKMYQEVCIK